MTIQEARDALEAQYISQGLIGPFPKPLVGVKVYTLTTTTNPSCDPPMDVLRIDVNAKALLYVPNESKPGVGFQGYRCVAYRAVSVLVSDSGVIA